MNKQPCVTLEKNNIEKRFNWISIPLICIVFVRQISLLVWGTTTFASFLFVLMFIAFAALFAFYLIINKKISKLQIGAFIIIILMLAFLQEAFFANMESVLPFALALLALSLLNSDPIFNGVEHIYKPFVVIISILLVFCAFLEKNYIQDQLLYYTKNPNQSATIILCYFVNIFAFRFSEDKTGSRKFKIFYDVLLIALALVAYRTESRTVLISMVLMILFVFVSRMGVKKCRCFVYIFFFIAVFSPYFVTLILNWLGTDFKLLGETVKTGREIVWRNVTDVISRDWFAIYVGEAVPVVGMDYYGEGLDCHNSILEISWRYSSFLCVFFVVFMFFTLKKIMSQFSEKNIRILLPILIAVIFHMTCETAFFIGAFDYTLLVLMPMMIYLRNTSDENKKSLL